jgi:two-component system, NtrC family, sensor kinase
MNSHLDIKILLIEDNPNDAELAKLKLAEVADAFSYEMFHVELLREALEFLQKMPVDVILLDLSLPDAREDESVHALQKNFSQIPIIILSGSKESAWMLRIVQVGVQDYIQKNRFDGELLGHAIRYAIERKKSEQALVNSKAETERLLASISYILIGVGEHDQIIQWNRTAEKFFGRTVIEVLGTPFCQCGIQWDWKRVVQGILQCREEGIPVHLNELWYLNGNGKKGIFDLTLTNMSGNTGESRGFVILANDISERKQLEHQLFLAKKMESIGLLAAGIAHEINTPTQFVSDNLHFLQDSFHAIQNSLTIYAQLLKAVESGHADSRLVDAMKRTLAETDIEFMKEEIPKALKQSLDGATRVSKIIQAMKDFSHPGTEEKKPIDVNRAIESTAIVARNEWKYVADMVTVLDSALPLVPCKAGEFNQVILNLLVNAAHAIEDVVAQTKGNKGTITINTRVEEEWVEVRITDTGTGIPEAARDKIFDPFFTTKEVGKGTGQGLAIAHDIIVKKHEGTLTFETELGQGTTFMIRLPLSLNVNHPKDRGFLPMPV